jgi:hypothetical protein
LMTQTPAHNIAGTTRLTQLLARLDAGRVSTQVVTPEQRLSRLIDLSDAIRLARALLGPAGSVDSTFAETDIASIRNDYLQVRGRLLENIIASLDTANPAGQRRLPGPVQTNDPPTELGRYQRFYAAHQRELDFRIDRLQERVRLAAANTSPGLKHLAQLDSTLGELLANTARRHFAAIPGLIASRHLQLNNTFPPPLAHAGLCRELKQLLLAEIDARLLPVLGLVEAMEHDPGAGH